MHADYGFELGGANAQQLDLSDKHQADDFELAEPTSRDTWRNPARDPRLDPSPGDILVVGDDAREVWDVLGVQHRTVVEYSAPGKARTRTTTLTNWRLWARKADVRKVAR